MKVKVVKEVLKGMANFTWESAHARNSIIIIMFINCLGYDFYIYGASEFLCHSIANL